MEIKRDGLFSHHTLSEKEKKNLLILDLIRKKGPISRTTISEITDINIVSISNYIKSYISENFVFEKGHDVSTGGRRPELVEFNPKGAYVVGLDLTSSDFMAVMTDLALNVVEKIKMARPPKTAKEELAEKMAGLVRELITKSKIDPASIKAIGIGIPGDNYTYWGDEIEKRLGVRTFMGSDAACAAFGEKRVNPEADVEDLLYMYSDIGCGIVIKGDIYFGACGAAGEMASFNEEMLKEESSMFINESQYLRPWCIDLGIVQAAKREIKRGIGTRMVALAGGNVENVSKQVVIEAARLNDDMALDIIKSAGINLGIRTAYLVNLFDPEIVVIGGSIEKAGDLILEPIKKAINKFVLTRRVSRVRIIPSVLGDDAVSLGAAALAIREIFIKA